MSSPKLLVDFTTLDFPSDGEVVELNEDASLFDAIKLLTDHSISALPIWVKINQYIEILLLKYTTIIYHSNRLNLLHSLKVVVNTWDFSIPLISSIS